MAAIVLAGCSTDIARFDFPPTFNLTEGTRSTPATAPPSGMRTGSAAFDSAPPAQRPSGNSNYQPPRADRQNDMRMSALPEPTGAGAPERSFAPLTPSPNARPDNRSEPRNVRAVPVAAPARAGQGGSTITVESGDTLYGLSRKHGVSISELMSVNGLTSPRIRPGQQLALPAGDATQIVQPTPTARAAPVRPERIPRPAVVAQPASGGPGTYTVQPGDSLYKIARQHGTTIAALKSTNVITDPRALRPGMLLQMPGEDGATRLAAAPPRAAPVGPVRPAGTTSASPSDMAPSEKPSSRIASSESGAEPRPMPAVEAAPQSQSGSVAMPTIVNGAAGKVAASEPQTVSDVQSLPTVPPLGAKPVKVAEVRPDPPPLAKNQPPMAGKLRWPAKGKVIAPFGARRDGGHNDGINLAVPLGSDVHAAESGVVAYAGSELKDYGNLVLIRHDNGWVTAYAHNDQILVKRGDKVRRGQVVAKAGKSGAVDQPQVHFELRLGSKPVDPIPYLEKS